MLFSLPVSLSLSLTSPAVSSQPYPNQPPAPPTLETFPNPTPTPSPRHLLVKIPAIIRAEKAAGAVRTKSILQTVGVQVDKTQSGRRNWKQSRGTETAAEEGSFEKRSRRTGIGRRPKYKFGSLGSPELKKHQVLLLQTLPEKSAKPSCMLYRHTLKPFNIIKGKSLPDWASLAIIFGDSVADGRDEFASNDPELVEAEADDDKGSLLCFKMDEDMEFFYLCAQSMALICILGYYYSYGYWDRVHDSILIGKFYLVDGGYANTRGFVASYRGIRYHLKEWSTTQAPQTPQELFNLRHSKARNVVERTFAVLKQRFPILKTTLRYPLNTQAKIVVACCVMYNYIKQWNYNDELEEGSVLEMDVDENINVEEDTEVGSVPSDANTRFACALRDAIAQQLWDD
ncbi:putative nuclease HARBI1 [Cinnamomum micranthum f. kanehirae]|uniref:Putative nuclease HARBI1 n=1 Tax=Cinnamomum micranthum f. kanehirae TaxID=337451 RepID=A0A3S3NMP0_9MAGN|nr:putative nuclease HARBI1 [Cinnamomum micranthum f. kanehirae]